MKNYPKNFYMSYECEIVFVIPYKDNKDSIAKKSNTLSYIMPICHRISMVSLNNLTLVLLLHFSRASQCKRIRLEYYLFNTPITTLPTSLLSLSVVYRWKPKLYRFIFSSYIR